MASISQTHIPKHQLSVALVTRNRHESLVQTLHSIEPQRNEIFEIVISDDSDDPMARTKNRLFAKSFNCRYLEGPRRGLYANRNFVAKACTGSHIRTMDDDHEFPPDHFATCWLHITKNPADVLVCSEFVPPFPTVPGVPPIAGQLHPRGFSTTPDSLPDYWGISCGTTIYPRQLIDNNILNVEFFKFGASYLEYGARLRFLGQRIVPILDTYIFHHHYPANRSYSQNSILFPARYFAMLCFSFLYCPSPQNQLLTIGQIAREFASSPHDTLRYVKQAIKCILLHKIDLKRQVNVYKTIWKPF